MPGKPGRPKAELSLSDAERSELERLSRRPKSSQALAQRARIALACATGATNREVAEQVGVSVDMVGKWRQRFVALRLDGLSDEPRSGAPRKISDEDVERVITMTLESTPKGATHWSNRSLAKAAGMTPATIRRIWNAFALQPHRVETFKLSTDPYFIDKVRDVVGLYLNPPEKAVVLCVDEKSQIQALDRSQPVLPMRPGQVERRSHDYKRHGTTSLFAAFNCATGEVIGTCYRRHRSAEFRRFLDLVDKQVPQDLEVHLVLDNYGTHKTALIHRWLAKRPRFNLHFTPTSSSWLNLVERWFGELTNRQIRRGVHRSVAELEAAISSYLQSYNQDARPFVWTKTADQIFEGLGRFCGRTSDAGH
jgi:transposase